MRKVEDRSITDSQQRARAMAPCDWEQLGARIRRAARAATAMHLIHAAGGRLDSGTVLETPWVLTGG
jgi:hypothetical protein